MVLSSMFHSHHQSVTAHPFISGEVAVIIELLESSVPFKPIKMLRSIPLEVQSRILMGAAVRSKRT